MNERLRLEVNQPVTTTDQALCFKLLDAIEKSTEELRGLLVRDLRTQERSWEWISERMGLSRQHVWETYRHRL